jgi:putative ATP-dependent endonuclease of OLD family
LRRTLTVFMGTGENAADGTEYSAPFHHQGTGTINTLILAMLSLIAELKQNVIFAMEEPEIAIPPHTQRRIVSGVKGMSAQSIFTSHSPYVLDEFEPKQVLLLRRDNGVLTGVPATLPPAVKAKAYREELRTRFCECLLARRVLIVEGRTEFDVMPVAARRLHELAPGVYKTFENLGIAVINAGGETNVAPLGDYFRTLGKETFAITDRQDANAGALIRSKIDHFYESPEDNFEKLLLNQTAESALRRFAASAVHDDRWPQHMAANTPNATMPIEDLKGVLRDFLKHSKGEGEAAQLISICRLSEMPDYLKTTILAIKLRVEPPQPPPPPIILPVIPSE